MRFDQLIFFVELSKHVSLNMASERLGISQQALSASIKTMEQELNVCFLHRNQKGCTLTPEGEIFLAFAKETIEQYDEVIKKIHSPTVSSASNEQGCLYVYAVSLYYFSLYSESINSFCKKYPNIQLSFHELSLNEIIHRLNEVPEKDTHHIGFINLPCDKNTIPYFPSSTEDNSKLSYIKEEIIKDFTFYQIAKAGYIACVSRDCALAHLKKVSIKTLLKYPIILGSSKDNLTSALYFLLRQYGEPNFTFTAPNFHLWQEVINKNNGIGFMNKLFLSESKKTINNFDNLVFIDIKENIQSVATFVLKDEPSTIIKYFTNLLPKSTKITF